VRGLLPLLLLACTAPEGFLPSDTAPVLVPSVDADADPPDRLSAFGLLGLDDGALVYADGVVPYELTTPLFSDYALKARAVWLPDGTTASWSDDDVLDLPVGSALLKTFLYPADMRTPDVDRTVVETRVMLRGAEGWSVLPYVWNAAQTDADLKRGGDVQERSFIDVDGETQTFSYLVPQRNQCLDCHEILDGEERVTVPIGIKARYLQRDGQLHDLVDRGLLTGAPDLDTVDAAAALDDVAGIDVAALTYEEITATARAYLDINCAHCHKPDAVEGETSRLYLDVANEDPFHLGVCKRPGSAGRGGIDRTYDIVPGDHEASILHYRMVTDDIGAMMPEFGRALVHDEGARLVAAWIDGMEGSCAEE
jgi:uncharacterized repeat protein (TIGR03806 family)